MPDTQQTTPIVVCTGCYRIRVARWLLGAATHIDRQRCPHATPTPGGTP